MKKKNKEKKEVKCIAYLSVFSDEDKFEEYEERQLKKITEYAKANNISIVRVLHKDILGQREVDKHIRKIATEIKNKKADGLIVFSMRSITDDYEDAYSKVGRIRAAGGRVFTVKDGEMKMTISGFRQESV